VLFASLCYYIYFIVKWACKHLSVCWLWKCKALVRRFMQQVHYLAPSHSLRNSHRTGSARGIVAPQGTFGVEALAGHNTLVFQLFFRNFFPDLLIQRVRVRIELKLGMWILLVHRVYVEWGKQNIAGNITFSSSQKQRWAMVLVSDAWDEFISSQRYGRSVIESTTRRMKSVF
jgi:hypothetical protein